MTDAKMKAAAAGGLSAVALALAVPIIAYFEGLVQKPYRDPVGILTVCYGHTGKDIEQRTYSKDECAQMLARDAAKHAEALKCIKTPLKDYEQAAFISFAYNIGGAKFCSSTLVKKANAGDMAGACAELSRWTKGGGKTLPGLVKRRSAERAMCEGDKSAGGISYKAPAVVLQGSAAEMARAICEGETISEAADSCEKTVTEYLEARNGNAAGI